jgi:hypothetical protein
MKKLQTKEDSCILTRSNELVLSISGAVKPVNIEKIQNKLKIKYSLILVF